MHAYSVGQKLSVESDRLYYRGMTMSRSPPSEVMNITSMVDDKRNVAMGGLDGSVGPHGAMHEHHLLTHHQLAGAAIDRTNSPHGSESSYHSAHRSTGNALDALSGITNHRPYGSPSSLHTPLHTPMQTPLQMPDNIPSSVPAGVMIPGMPTMGSGVHMGYNKPPDMPQQANEAKPYPCSTCGKGFARRSDLARHERIHSGHRPHVCDHMGCGKQFIQRSALTVHQRVHTGEKPHMCERCGKPFSDSSSLARHRRIHSGKRPYKCPYADCQKTFTRRTTLTRHQNHHTGTVEEAAAATAAALAEQAAKNAIKGVPKRAISPSDAAAAAAALSHHGSPLNHGSPMNQGSPMHHGSPLNSPSPGQRTMSMSPSAELAAANAMRQQNDFSYLSSVAVPAHLRTDMPAMHSQSPTSAPTYATTMRPTSHPHHTAFAPPPTLEPNLEPNQSPAGSVAGSPHMGSVGWQSPTHMASPTHHMASPTHSNPGNAYVYPDPDQSPFTSNHLGQMYYNGVGQLIRRPNSTDPGTGGYDDVKPRPNELWAGAQ